jgi:hypothetical protein
MTPHRLDSQVPFIAISRQDQFHVVHHDWRRRQLSAVLAGVTTALVVTILSGCYLMAYQPTVKILAMTALGTLIGLWLLAMCIRLRRGVTTDCSLHLDDGSSTLLCQGINRGSPVAVSIPYASVSVLLRPISVVSPRGESSWDGWLAQLQLGTGPCLDLAADADADKCAESIERVLNQRFRIELDEKPVQCVGARRPRAIGIPRQ